MTEATPMPALSSAAGTAGTALAPWSALIRAHARFVLPLCVTAFVRDELYGLSGHDEDPEQVNEQISAYFAALPPAQFPHLAAIGMEVTQVGWDERDDGAVDVVVAGLAAQASVSGPRSGSP